jgi:hypothetical protein
MEQRSFQTPFGEVWLWGKPAAFDGDRPLVLVIRGAMPLRHALEWLQPSEADIVFAHLPGFHSPVLVASSIGVFIAAFDVVIRQAFADRSIVVLGVSAGAIVAAGLRAPQLAARVLIEPFFSTAKLKPLAAVVRRLLADANEPYRRWVWHVLGIALDAVEDRRYGHLLTPDLPIYAVVGDVPLSQPPPAALPSLTDDADRALLIEAGADLRVARGGHDMPSEDPGAIVAAMLDATRSLRPT